MDEVRDEIRSLGPWHHDVEIAPGLRTGDPTLAPEPDPARGTPRLTDPYRDMRVLLADVFPNGLEGRAFLDCACNAGGHSLAAHALGAGRCFGFDARPHWIAQARFLARHLPSENVDFAVGELADLPALGVGPFDVTLFRGIFYHLPDPVAGLKIAADLTRELIIVNTATQPAPGKALILNREGVTPLMSGVHHLAWLPTGPEVVQDILAYCGFPHSRVRYDIASDAGRNRIEIVAAREAATLADHDRLRPPAASVPARRGPMARLGRLLTSRRSRPSIGSSQGTPSR